MATLLTPAVWLGAPDAAAGDVDHVSVTVTLGGVPVAGAFVAVRTTAGNALGGATTGSTGMVSVSLPALSPSPT